MRDCMRIHKDRYQRGLPISSHSIHSGPMLRSVPLLIKGWSSSARQAADTRWTRISVSSHCPAAGHLEIPPIRTAAVNRGTIHRMANSPVLPDPQTDSYIHSSIAADAEILLHSFVQQLENAPAPEPLLGSEEI